MSIVGGNSLRIEFGRRWFLAQQAGKLQPGCVIELDSPADDCVDICVNGRPTAKGAPVVLDGKLCVRVKEAQS